MRLLLAEGRSLSRDLGDVLPLTSSVELRDCGGSKGKREGGGEREGERERVRGRGKGEREREREREIEMRQIGIWVTAAERDGWMDGWTGLIR